MEHYRDLIEAKTRVDREIDKLKREQEQIIEEVIRTAVKREDFFLFSVNWRRLYRMIDKLS